jgi:hypothetical protein
MTGIITVRVSLLEKMLNAFFTHNEISGHKFSVYYSWIDRAKKDNMMYIRIFKDDYNVLFETSCQKLGDSK